MILKRFHSADNATLIRPTSSGTPLRVQFKQGENPFAEPENKRKAGEGIVSMRRRKTAQRAELKAKKDEENKKH